MKRVLQLFGLLALVLWTGSGVAAWMLVGERVQLTFAGDQETGAHVDPLALLRDDVAAAQRDVSALSENVGTALDALSASLQQAAVAREAARTAELQALRAELRAWRDEVPAALASATAAAALAQAAPPAGSSRAHAAEPCEPGAPPAHDPIAAALAAASPAPAPAPAPEVTVPPAAQRSIEPEPAADPTPQAQTQTQPQPQAQTQTQTQPTPASAEPAPAPPGAHKSFLAFTLPSTGLRFDQPQRFDIQSTLSRVGFDAKSTLHDFSGVTSRVTGELTLDLAHTDACAHGSITVDAEALRTGLDGRDSAMREHLDVDHHRQITFELTQLAAATVDATALTVTGTAHGRMTIRGVTHELAMPVRLHVDAGKRLVIEGECPLRLTDYAVPVPSQLGLINMQDEVKVWVALRARCLGAPKEKQ